MNPAVGLEAVGIDLRQGRKVIGPEGAARVLDVPKAHRREAVEIEPMADRRRQVVRQVDLVVQRRAAIGAAVIGVRAGFARVQRTMDQGIEHPRRAIVGRRRFVMDGAQGEMDRTAKEVCAPIGIFLQQGAGRLVGLASRGLERAAVGAVLEDDVDHPGHGVRTVLGRGAVTQIFDVIDGAGRDQVEVHGRGAAAHGGEVVDKGRVVPPLAVDQHQDVVAGEALDGEGRHAGGGAAAVLRGQGQRRNDRRQDLLQPGLARLGELGMADDVDRHGAVGDRARLTPQTGDHDLLDRRRPSVRRYGRGGARHRRRIGRVRGNWRHKHPQGYLGRAHQ